MTVAQIEEVESIVGSMTDWPGDSVSNLYATIWSVSQGIPIAEAKAQTLRFLQANISLGDGADRTEPAQS